MDAQLLFYNLNIFSFESILLYDWRQRNKQHNQWLSCLTWFNRHLWPLTILHINRLIKFDVLLKCTLDDYFLCTFHSYISSWAISERIYFLLLRRFKTVYGKKDTLNMLFISRAFVIVSIICIIRIDLSWEEFKLKKFQKMWIYNGITSTLKSSTERR